jgi:hypothetical protein
MLKSRDTQDWPVCKYLHVVNWPFYLRVVRPNREAYQVAY